MLNLTNISCGYRIGQNILSGIDFTVPAGKITAVIGLNGSGKSTLVKAVIRQLQYITGEITLFNQNLVDCHTYEIIKLGVGYFPQGGFVFPNLTVLDNLRISGHGMKRKDFYQRISEVRQFNSLMSDITLNEKAGNLSLGQKHLLALTMTLIKSPKLLVLDEPSAGLSPMMRKDMFSIINYVNENEEVTVLIIEQNVKEVFQLADDTYFLRNSILKKMSSIGEIEQLIFK